MKAIFFLYIHSKTLKPECFFLFLFFKNKETKLFLFKKNGFMIS